MRKKVLFVLTVLFFGLMLFGTLFHQKIDGLFREKVSVVTPEPYQERVTKTWEVNGTEREFNTSETFLLLPEEAVHNNMVYLLETVEMPYGSYEVIRLRMVETAGEAEGMIKIKRGLSELDRIVAVFDENLEDGMRVVVK